MSGNFCGYLKSFCIHANSLRYSGLLRSIRSYPTLFAPFLINTGEVTVDDVLQAIYIDDENATT